MGWNGAGVVDRTDGTRTGSQVWQEAADAGVLIRDVDHDTHDQDLADAIEKCLNRDGENAAAADIGWGGFKLTSLGNGTARADAANVGQVQDSGPLWGGTSAGSANAQTIALSPAISAYVAGLTVRFIAGFTITGAATLNVNGVGPKTLASRGGNGLLSGEIVEDEWVTAIYDGTDFRVQKEVVRETVYTAGATWNKPGGLVFVDVEVVGGGGGSGGCAATSAGENAEAGGGGGGGYSRKKIPTSDLGSSETVTVGAGGSGGAAGANNGSQGGTSSFGAHASATGGSGGTGGAATSGNDLTGAGAGGSGSSGDVNADGGSGMFGRVLSGEAVFQSAGGTSVYAGAVKPSGSGTGGVGTQGNAHGGGAAGAQNRASQTAKAGGDGGAGLVIVREHL